MSRYYQSIAFSIALGSCAVTFAVAQGPGSAAVITGVVVDSSTSDPVAGAIAFIARNGIGTSTGPDGRFVLPRVPAGEYDLVVSRVGYRRALFHIIPGGSDTLTLTVMLVPAPTEVGGTEVTAEAGTAPAAAPLFMPDGGEKSWCAFGSETEVPVGILYTEKLLLFYHLDTVRDGDEAFIRFWLLIYNGSGDTVEFDAGRDVRLDVEIGTRNYPGVKPGRPVGSDGISVESGIALRNMPVEHTLFTLASQSQLFIDEALRFELKAGMTPGATPTPWLGWLAPPESPHGVNPRHLRKVYDLCVHHGVLGRYRIAPGIGVDGTIRYPMPGFGAISMGSPRESGARPRFEFTIVTPTGEERIVFSMH